MDAPIVFSDYHFDKVQIVQNGCLKIDEGFYFQVSSLSYRTSCSIEKRDTYDE